ncbi:MAG: MHS family MFS transporter [Phycisphaerae bacterium]|nr:MHS family MFS transporter [Phycisphaerae bacterium]
MPVHPAIESRRDLWKIIFASSAGTLIEWYDFYIFASLATVVSAKFFPDDDGLLAFLKTLAVVWIGFAVRPFGAVIFGYLGDVIGRKHTFLVTLLLMGGATFAIGILPTYATAGAFAPIALLILRLMQGLALGGEYGGAATYIAEHAPDGQRGFWTSWIQTTATLGLFVSLGVILACRLSMSAESFSEWGWRIPFLLSIALVVFSYILRSRMKESPVFQRMKASGKGSRNPIRDSFANRANLKFVLLALFGAAAGQGVVWYTGQFYALFFLQRTVKVELVQSNIIIGAALLIATPLFILTGWLSDRIGRKPIMLTGCALAAATYIPIFMGIMAQGDLSRKIEAAVAVTGSTAPPAQHTLTVPDALLPAAAGETVTIETVRRVYTDGTTATETRTTAAGGASRAEFSDVRLGTRPLLLTLGLIVVLVAYVAMVYGPIAAFLVELFPTRIRYTSMSLPYHIGNGVFGGLVPFASTWLAAYVSQRHPGHWFNPYAGLAYPIAIAALTVLIGGIFIRENRHARIDV